MESYPLDAEFPHAVYTSSYEAFDPSLPADHLFVTEPCQDPPLDQAKSRENLTPQPWWNCEDSSLSTPYLSPQHTVYPNRFSPWNSALSTISDPQSPRSSNSGSIPGMSCIASPPFGSEDVQITAVDEQGRCPAPDGLVDIDRSTMTPQPRLLEVPSPYEHDFGVWSGSQSDRHITPEQQWSSPMPGDATVFTQPRHRPKTRQASKSRIRKPSGKRPSSAPGHSRRRRGATHLLDGHNGPPRTFVCSFAPYGCESTFVSKNEWKRHVTSQHLQLGFYRCDVGKCSMHTPRSSPKFLQTPSTSVSSFSHPGTTIPPQPPPGQPNDFNRKDLFTQHQRRMHAPWLQTGRRRTPTDEEHVVFETSLEEVRRRCWHELRQPPQESHCGFCREVFAGEGSWDVRMEHVGRHFERDDAQSLGEELEDLSLREWGLREGILSVVDGTCRLASLVELEV